jgi:hypothetical protein
MNSFTHDSHALLEEHPQHLQAPLQQHPEQTITQPSRVRRFFDQISQSAWQWLTQGNTPRISRFIQGDVEVWKVYDPINNRTLCFTDEDEVRAWLERRYYS